MPKADAAAQAKAKAIVAAGEAELARRSLIDFATRCYPGFMPAPHLAYIAGLLEKVERGEERRIIIATPPGHGKSTLLQLFAAWYLGKHPDHRIISTSAAERLVMRNSRAVRDFFREPSWPFEAKLSSDVSASGFWETDKGGGCFGVGVDGVVTGIRAQLVICDDIQDGRGSSTEQDSIEDWLRGKLLTRLEPNGAAIVIQTRWARSDIPGRLMAGPRGNAWTYVRLPAISEGDGDPLERPEGAALWPERFSAAMLDEIREEIGSKNYASQYACSPVVDGGEVFRADWFERYDVNDLPRDERGQLSFSKVVCALDSSAKTGVRNDYSVCLTIGEHNRRYYVLDCRREKVEYPALKRMVIAQNDKWRPSHFYVEDSSAGTALSQQLKAESSLPVIPVKVTVSKEARAEAVSGTVEAGRVLLPREARWLAEFEDEVCSFPSGDHDDIVDAFTLTLSQLNQRMSYFSFTFDGHGASEIEGDSPEATAEWRRKFAEIEAEEAAREAAEDSFLPSPLGGGVGAALSSLFK